MKAQDLRIGNFVFDDQNEICCVSKLLSQKKISFEGNGVEDWEVEFKDEKADNIYLSCVINPIPLTEEWLIKFGFEKKWPGCWQNGFGLIIRESIEGKFDVRLSDYLGYITLDYVHELQNLYHALTGEELTLK